VRFFSISATLSSVITHLPSSLACYNAAYASALRHKAFLRIPLENAKAMTARYFSIESDRTTLSAR